MKLYILEILFQKYKERAKWTPKSNVMANLREVVFLVSEELVLTPSICIRGVNTNSSDPLSEELVLTPPTCHQRSLN